MRHAADGGKALLQTVGDALQQRIAGLVAEHMVDVSEIVDVELDQGDVRAARSRGVDIVVELVDERGVVGQAGECVEIGEIVNARLVELAPADVLHRADDASKFAVNHFRFGQHADPEQLAVWPGAMQFDVIGDTALEQIFDAPVRLVARLRVVAAHDQVFRRPSALRNAIDAIDRVIPGPLPRLHVEFEAADLGHAGGLRQPFLVGLEFARRAPAQNFADGDVGECGQVACSSAPKLRVTGSRMQRVPILMPGRIRSGAPA